MILVFQKWLCAEMMMTMDDDNAFSSCTLKLVDAAIQGPSGGMSRGVPLFGSFDAMKSPVGFRGYEGASFSDTQLNKDPAGLRATMPGANPGVVSSGADGHESSLKTPHFGVSDRQMAKMVTCPPTASSSSRNPKPTRARRFAGQSDPWGA